MDSLFKVLREEKDIRFIFIVLIILILSGIACVVVGISQALNY